MAMTIDARAGPAREDTLFDSRSNALPASRCASSRMLGRSPVRAGDLTADALPDTKVSAISQIVVAECVANRVATAATDSPLTRSDAMRRRSRRIRSARTPPTSRNRTVPVDETAKTSPTVPAWLRPGRLRMPKTRARLVNWPPKTEAVRAAKSRPYRRFARSTPSESRTEILDLAISAWAVGCVAFFAPRESYRWRHCFFAGGVAVCEPDAATNRRLDFLR